MEQYKEPAIELAESSRVGEEAQPVLSPEAQVILAELQRSARQREIDLTKSREGRLSTGRLLFSGIAFSRMRKHK